MNVEQIAAVLKNKNLTTKQIIKLLNDVKNSATIYAKSSIPKTAAQKKPKPTKTDKAFIKTVINKPELNACITFSAKINLCTQLPSARTIKPKTSSLKTTQHKDKARILAHKSTSNTKVVTINLLNNSPTIRTSRTSMFIERQKAFELMKPKKLSRIEHDAMKNVTFTPVINQYPLRRKNSDSSFILKRSLNCSTDNSMMARTMTVSPHVESQPIKASFNNQTLMKAMLLKNEFTVSNENKRPIVLQRFNLMSKKK